jgi:tRNA (mo5U34)-methyltransferase
MVTGEQQRDLREEIAAISWYHTIDLHGVLTPGIFDTVSAAPRTLLPADLSGKRCLDVATSNGFWAFEMERRGAEEVVAIDIPAAADADWPAFDPIASTEFPSARPDFQLAHRTLGSSVERHDCSVYDVAVDQLGTFDVVFVGSLLLHLRDPVRALMALRELTGGQLVLNESISIPLTVLRPRSAAARLIGTGGSNWWVPNRAGLVQMVRAAGFEPLEVGRPYPLRWGGGAPRQWGRTVEGARAKGLVRNAGRMVLGIPHVGVRARARRG